MTLSQSAQLLNYNPRCYLLINHNLAKQYEALAKSASTAIELEATKIKLEAALSHNLQLTEKNIWLEVQLNKNRQGIYNKKGVPKKLNVT